MTSKKPPDDYKCLKNKLIKIINNDIYNNKNTDGSDKGKKYTIVQQYCPETCPRHIIMAHQQGCDTPNQRSYT